MTKTVDFVNINSVGTRVLLDNFGELLPYFLLKASNRLLYVT